MSNYSDEMMLYNLDEGIQYQKIMPAYYNSNNLHSEELKQSPGLIGYNKGRIMN
jgi:hypothetical protein